MQGFDKITKLFVRRVFNVVTDSGKNDEKSPNLLLRALRKVKL